MLTASNGFIWFQLANKYWAPHAKNKLPFDPKVSSLQINMRHLKY